MFSNIFNLVKEFIVVTILPWGVFWFVAFFVQWRAVFFRRRGIANDLHNSELENSEYFDALSIPDAVEVSWYIRLFLGLPPTRGLIELGAAQAQLECVICAIINWLWLRLANDYSVDMQLTIRVCLLLLLVLMNTVFQKLLVSKFSERKPRNQPVLGLFGQSIQEIPTNALAMIPLKLAIVLFFLTLGIRKILGQEWEILWGLIASLSFFLSGCAGLVYIIRREYPLSPTHYLRGQRAVNTGIVILVAGWGMTVLFLIILFT